MWDNLCRCLRDPVPCWFSRLSRVARKYRRSRDRCIWLVLSFARDTKKLNLAPGRTSARPADEWPQQMTRKHDRQMRSDRGATKDEMIARGYVLLADGQMHKNSNIKYECHGCGLWFDEVRRSY